jgi:hypothetical protein
MSLFSLLDEDTFNSSETATSPQIQANHIRPHSRAVRQKQMSEDSNEFAKTEKYATLAISPKMPLIDYASISKGKSLAANSDNEEFLAAIEKRLFDFELEEPFLVPVIDSTGKYLPDQPLVNLLKRFDDYSSNQVAHWVSTLARCTKEPQHVVEMNWSGAFLLNSCEPELQRLVKERLSIFPVSVRGYGPLVFKIIAELIYTVDEGVLSNMIEAARGLKLSDFEGENVTKALQVLRSCRERLRTLNRPLPDFAHILMELYLGCSHERFRQKYDNLLVHNDPHIYDADWLFRDGDENYRRYVQRIAWIKPTKAKRGAAFQAEAPPLDAIPAETLDAAHLVDRAPPTPPAPARRTPKTHDASGNPIDRVPPKAGQSLTRHLNGRTDHWCPKCKRWGNHLEDGHDPFWEQFRKNGRGKQKQDDNNQPTPVPGVSFDPPNAQLSNYSDVIRKTGKAGPLY